MNVSAQLSALLGVVVGAFLAGGGNLLLAWRDETIQARTGVYLIRKILEEARDEVCRLRGQKTPLWKVESLPDSQLWTQYRPAVSARLSLATLQKIDKAMRRLDTLNGAAARAWKLGDEHEQRIWEAAARDDTRAVNSLMMRVKPEQIPEVVIKRLPAAQEELEAAFDALAERTPTGLPGRTRNLKAFRPWARWHWRSLSVCVISLAVVVLIVLGVTTNASESSEVQDALADHFNHPALTACESVKDHEDDFSCVVAEVTSPPSCKAAVAAGSSDTILLARTTVTKPDEGSSCDLITRALQYSAQRQHDADCTAFFETGVSSVPAQSAKTLPGFFARMTAKLRKSGATEGVPDVILPGSAFTADC